MFCIPCQSSGGLCSANLCKSLFFFVLQASFLEMHTHTLYVEKGHQRDGMWCFMVLWKFPAFDTLPESRKILQTNSEKNPPKNGMSFAILSLFNVVPFFHAIGFAIYTARRKWHSVWWMHTKESFIPRQQKNRDRGKRDFSHLTIDAADACFWKYQTISNTKEKSFSNKKAGKTHFFLPLSKFNSNLAFSGFRIQGNLFSSKNMFS